MVKRALLHSLGVFRVGKVWLLKSFLSMSFAEVVLSLWITKGLGWEQISDPVTTEKVQKQVCLNRYVKREIEWKNFRYWEWTFLQATEAGFGKLKKFWPQLFKVALRPKFSENQGDDSYLSWYSMSAFCEQPCETSCSFGHMLYALHLNTCSHTTCTSTEN